MYRDILRKYWGYDDFRGIQEDIIESIGNNRDTLGLMPTGGGKSITFQVPALAKEGICIVITPLIALMKDQVNNLRKRGILAAAIYSGMSHKEIVKTLDNSLYGDYKFLYVSPERLNTPLFQSKLHYMNVSFITVDEAHCVSQWGYDFRPSYLSIADIRKTKTDVAILALTATATEEVVDDIQDKLGFREKNVFRMSFERKNLTYVVRETADRDAETIHILNSVPGTAIVYTRSRKGTKDMSKLLNDNGINATFYHAGLESAVRDQRQQQWQNGEVRVMVATNAFGMGIDKPDVRMVIHRECPDSLEAYFQEAGRAGRDGKRSWSVLLHNGHDDHKMRRRIADNYPDKDFIRNVYEHLAYYFQVALGFGIYQTFEFDLEKFCLVYRMFPVTVNSALQILDNAGYIEYDQDPENNARLKFLLERSELDRLNYLSPEEEKVITMMMRLYGGLFVDYVYIDEAVIASHTGMEQNTVYLILKSLSKQHIVHFIPQRKMPRITYLRDRVEMENVAIPKEVYEYRRAAMEKKIDAVVEYVNNDRECRSRQLLRYFGEKPKHDCGRCDVCVSQAGKPEKGNIEKATEVLREFLADGKFHEFHELNTLRIPEKLLDAAIDRMIEEEELTVKANKIRKP